MRNTLITTINDNPHLHSFAAKLYLQFLSEQPKAREPLVVVGSILLRKFGHEIVNEPGFGLDFLDFFIYFMFFFKNYLVIFFFF